MAKLSRSNSCGGSTKKVTAIEIGHLVNFLVAQEEGYCTLVSEHVGLGNTLVSVDVDMRLKPATTY